MKNLIEDLSILTTIGKYNLESLTYKSIDIISHDIEESLRDNENYIEIDIGLGTLIISRVEEEIRYKFIPSKRLEKTVIDTYITRKSKVALDVDKALGDRIMKTYKDLF